MKLITSSLLAVASAKYIQDAGVASDASAIFNQVAADAMLYLENEGIFELTETGFALNASPYFEMAADISVGHYLVSYGEAPVNTIDVNWNADVDEDHVITHTGTLDKFEDMFTSHGIVNPCPSTPDFSQTITFSHVTCENFLNNDHSVTINDRACGMSLDFVDTFRIDTSEDANSMSFGASNTISVDVSPNTPSSVRHAISTMYPLYGDSHRCSVVASSNIELSCFQFQPCNAVASVVASQNSEDPVSTTATVDYNDFRACTNKSNKNRPNCGTVTYTTENMFEDDMELVAALRMNKFNNFQFIYTSEGVQVGSIDMIAETDGVTQNKKGKTVPETRAAPKLVAQGWTDVHFIRYKLAIAGDSTKYMVRVPIPNHFSAIEDAAIAWYSELQVILDSAMADMSADVPEDEYPNVVYAIVYADEFIALLDGKFDVSEIVSAVGFEFMAGRNVYLQKKQLRQAKKASIMIDTGLAFGQAFVREGRDLVFGLTGSQGQEYFEEAFADVL